MMARPIRIQLSRRKGWRMPTNTVKVDRTTKWGNPHDWRDWIDEWNAHLPPRPFDGEIGREDWCRGMAAQAFAEDVRDGTIDLPVEELRGKNLACWCPQTGRPQECHADVLLELANRERS